MTEDSLDTWSRGEAADVARAILAGKIGILEGCVPLAFLAHSAVPDWTQDADFLVIGTLAAETDELPLGAAREYWSAAALARADVEIRRLAERSRQNVETACRNIVARFAAPPAPVAEEQP